MTQKELLDQALAHWRECTDDGNERENRIRGREDAAFAAGEQWLPEDLRARKLEGRPALTFNRMEGILHQVENEARRNPVAIKISPVDDGIDKDTAAVDQGLVRQIQRDSRAEAGAHAAFVEACRTGVGAFALRARPVAADSFDQELYVEQIPDAINRLWWDPLAKQPDKSDARYMFEADVLPKDEYKRQHPKSEAASSGFLEDADGNMTNDWISDYGVRVANYWYVETRKRKLLYLEATGQTVFEDEAGELPAGVVASKSREVEERKIRCAKINGVEVLEEYELPGSSIWIFPVVGEEVWVDGAPRRYSLIHWAKDPQRLLNFYRSNEAELISLAPKTPWIVAEGQTEGYEEQWRTANRRNYSTLTYKPTTVAGQPVGPPQRNAFEAPIQALSAGAAQVIDEIKAGTSMYDASLGARSNETSGIAIQRRQAEGDLANFHYIDNYGRAWCACGRVVVEVKPYYYDTPRMILIMGEDEKERVVRVNEQYVDEKGVRREYLISDTKYNVSVAAGPSYTTMRQESYVQLTELARAYPPLMQAAGDVIMRKSDIPGADEIADRLKKTLPPGLADDGEAAGAPEVPPQIAARLQELTALNQQLTAALEEATRAAETRQAEIEGRKEIARLQEETKRLVALIKVESEEARELLRQELAQLGRRIDADYARDGRGGAAQPVQEAA